LFDFYLYPLIAFIDEHHRDVFNDGVFSPTIATYQPGLLDEIEVPLFLSDTDRAA
jgi:methyl coenzyme M reductase subunit C-like uncharacterized protein (methanogenesis marker protein 7)